MIQDTSLSHALTASDMKERYDQNAKIIVSHKVVLAWLLKCCVPEFKDFTVGFIEEECIEGKPEVAYRAVHQNQADSSADEKCNRIVGTNTEDVSIREQTVTYDIRFSAVVPGTKEIVELFINVEIQVNANPGYPLVKRGLYYCSRMISAQYGTVFTNSEYDKIRNLNFL